MGGGAAAGRGGGAGGVGSSGVAAMGPLSAKRLCGERIQRLAPVGAVDDLELVGVRDLGLVHVDVGVRRDRFLGQALLRQRGLGATVTGGAVSSHRVGGERAGKGRRRSRGGILLWPLGPGRLFGRLLLHRDVSPTTSSRAPSPLGCARRARRGLICDARRDGLGELGRRHGRFLGQRGGGSSGARESRLFVRGWRDGWLAGWFGRRFGERLDADRDGNGRRAHRRGPRARGPDRRRRRSWIVERGRRRERSRIERAHRRGLGRELARRIAERAGRRARRKATPAERPRARAAAASRCSERAAERGRVDRAAASSSACAPTGSRSHRPRSRWGRCDRRAPAGRGSSACARARRPRLAEASLRA